MRSKAAKIVLWVLVGLVGASLLSMGIIALVDMSGGTGTTHHWAMPLFGGAFVFFIGMLIMAYLLTEPSFKKKEEVIDDDDRFAYVKKAAQPKPVAAKKPEKKEEPESEEKKEEEAVAEKPQEELQAAQPEEEPEEEPEDEDEDDDEDDDDIADEADDDEENVAAAAAPINPDDDAKGAFVTAEDGVNTVYIRYRRSYMSRIIQASDATKSYYADIKNKMLSYKNVKARTSWGFESFNHGRTKIAKMNIRGKTLVIYFAIKPSELDAKYHIRDMSEKSKYSAVPSMLRVKSPRSAKYASDIIEQIMTANEVPVNEKYASESFNLEYRDTATLIDEGLIKIVFSSNIVPDENTVIEEANIADLINNK